MAKSNITEEMLRESVARGIPKPMGYTPPTHTSSEKSESEELVPPQKVEGRKRVTKSMSEEYIAVYLNKVDFPARQLIYVSKDTHRKLSNFVQIVGSDGATLSSYVENIIKRHLDDNKDIVNGLFKTHLEFPAE